MDSGSWSRQASYSALQGSELVDGVGPPLRPRPAVLRPLEGPAGLAGGAPLAPAALALGVGHAHGSTYPPTNRRIPKVNVAVAITVPTIHRMRRVSKFATSVRTPAISVRISSRSRQPVPFPSLSARCC